MSRFPRSHDFWNWTLSLHRYLRQTFTLPWFPFIFDMDIYLGHDNAEGCTVVYGTFHCIPAYETNTWKSSNQQSQTTNAPSFLTSVVQHDCQTAVLECKHCKTCKTHQLTDIQCVLSIIIIQVLVPQRFVSLRHAKIWFNSKRQIVELSNTNRTISILNWTIYALLHVRVQVDDLL